MIGLLVDLIEINNTFILLLMESIQLSKENNIVSVGRVASSSNALPRKTYITYEVA